MPKPPPPKPGDVRDAPRPPRNQTVQFDDPASIAARLREVAGDVTRGKLTGCVLLDRRTLYTQTVRPGISVDGELVTLEFQGQSPPYSPPADDAAAVAARPSPDARGDEAAA